MSEKVKYSLIGTLVLGAAISLSWFWLGHPPKAERGQRKRIAPRVDVLSAQAREYAARIVAHGTVYPTQVLVARSQTPGRVQRLHRNLVPGGFIKKGETIAQVDPRDYALAVEEQAGALAQVQTENELEAARRKVAEEELAKMGIKSSGGDQALILRGPQRAALEAQLKAATAQAKRAKLNHSRTRLAAPFAAIVQSKNTNVGALVSQADVVATLMGTELFEIELLVPVFELKFIEEPHQEDGKEIPGSAVTISDAQVWGPGVTRVGYVHSIAKHIDSAGRMARVLVRIDDPLSIKDPTLPKMLAGSFVKAEISGRSLGNVVELPRRAIRSNNHIWVAERGASAEAGEDGFSLTMREITLLHEVDDSVFISANELTPGELVVASDLGAPVKGMAIRTRAIGEKRGPVRAEQPSKKPHKNSDAT